MPGHAHLVNAIILRQRALTQAQLASTKRPETVDATSSLLLEGNLRARDRVAGPGEGVEAAYDFAGGHFCDSALGNAREFALLVDVHFTVEVTVVCAGLLVLQAGEGA